MRHGLLLSLALAACTSTSTDTPDSVRDRLESDSTELVVTADSTGSITAQRRASGGWVAGTMDLAVKAGELAATVDARGAIKVERFAVDLGPIDLPESALGYPAQLTDVHLVSARPVVVPASWSGGDRGQGTAQIELELSWSLTHHGKTSPLGAPKLPALPVELVLAGSGADVRAEARIAAAGTFWSWADLLKLEDLHLELTAITVTP